MTLEFQILPPRDGGQGDPRSGATEQLGLDGMIGRNGKQLVTMV